MSVFSEHNNVSEICVEVYTKQDSQNITQLQNAMASSIIVLRYVSTYQA